MATAPVSPSTATPQSSAAFGLDFQSLLKIILTQLTYQDPLKPLDNFEFVSQLAQFSQLEQSQELSTQMTNLVAAQAVNQATGLLGKTVDFTSGQTSGSGVVQAVSLSSGQPEVTVQTTDGQTIAGVSLAGITQILVEKGRNEMLGAIYTALSGMNAMSQGLQTISNNVSNMDTLGYKATNVNFEDVFSEGSGGLSYAPDTSGNEDGAGVKVGPPTIDFSQGNLQQTGNPLDLAIQGSGFLALLSGDNTVYARTGQFKVDDQGYVVDQLTGDRLAMLDSDNQLTPVNVDSNQTYPPAATTQIVFSDNLSSTATSDTVSNIDVYDSAGTQHVWQVAFAPVSSTPGQWTVTVTDETGATVGTGTLTFNGGTIDPTTAKINISTTPAGADPLNVTLDFSSGVTSFSSGTTSTLRASSVDGNAPGSLTTVTVNTAGEIDLAYSNGKDTVLGPVAIADFRDPQELQRTDNGLFSAAGTQLYRYVASGADGVGTLVSGQVESSNVNLSNEFGDLILIQRGFQACSEVVSTSNDMIQQLFDMRGQG